MTRDGVIQLAVKAGISPQRMSHPAWIQPSCPACELERFAALVAAAERTAMARHFDVSLRNAVTAEREACAAICDAEGLEWDSNDVVTEKNYAAHCAAAIRSRGRK